MFDLTSRVTYRNVPKWHRDLSRIAPNIPVVLVGNKADDDDTKIRNNDVEFHKKHDNVEFYDISVVTNYQFEKPLVSLLRSLCGDPKLELVESPKVNYHGDYISEGEVR